EKRVFLVILFTSFSGSLVSRIPGAVHLVCLIGYETIILHGYFTTSAQYDIVHNLKTLIIYPLPRLMPVASNGLFL
ncbi:hypothetical protein, partial [Escherichia coli]|uniref:hypothetical protein n=1 Tax=Escherichia coli TaxID=562 RepID=UPI001BC83F01